MRFGPVETDPVDPPARPRPRTSPTCAASPGGACRAACSTTSTAAPRTSARWPRTRRPSPHRLPAAGAARRRRGRPVDDAARPAAADPARARADRLHPHRRSRRASSPSPAPRRAPACRTRSRRSAPGRSRRSPRSATAAKWFQVYVWRDRGLVKEMIDRAAARRLRGAGAHRRHRGASAARARRAARLLAAAEDRARHAPRRRAPPGLDVGVRRARADPLRQRRPGATSATARTPSRWPTTSTPSSTRPVVARRRVAALDLGRPDRRQGHPDRRRRGASRPTTRRRRDRAVEPRRPPARRRAGDRRPRRAGRRRGRRPHSRSSATAACGGAATS